MNDTLTPSVSSFSQPEGWEFDAKIEPDAILRQGDLIAFPGAPSLHAYGLVVTADCDLKNRKHSRLITLVPVVDLRTIIERYLLLEQCDRQRSSLTNFVCKRFQVERDLDTPTTREELRSKVAEHRSVEGWETVCCAADVLLGDVESLTVVEFKSVMALISIPTDSLNKSIESQIRKKGDVVLLPSLENLGIKAEIAWVRWIWQSPMNRIALRNSEAGNGTGLRIARLSSPYRYRVTQVMGQVFSDIGTPDVPRDFVSDINFLIEGK